jgi:transcriptional regulator with XRE-family HTH domain
MKATKTEHNRSQQEESSDFFGQAFSANLRVLRAERGMTMQQLADKLGAGLTTVQNWEHGAVPRPAMVRKISELFGVPTVALLSEPIGPMILQEPQATYTARPRVKINPAFARPAEQPTREQVEAKVSAFLDAAEEVPGGIGHAWALACIHFNPTTLEALKIEE